MPTDTPKNSILAALEAGQRFCSNCGSKVIPSEARFCPNCGNELNNANKHAPEYQEKVSTPTSQKSVPPKPTHFNRIIFILIILFTASIYAGVLIPAFEGVESTNNEGIGFIIWNVMLFYTLFKRKNRKGVSGVITGLVFSFVIMAVAQVIAKTKQSEPDYILSHSPVYLAIQKYDPMTFQQMKTEMESLSQKRGITVQDVIAKLEPMTMVPFQKALTQTTDEAIVRFARIKLANLEKVANVSEEDCSTIISGNVNYDTQARILKYFSKQDTKMNNTEIASVIENAVGRPQQPVSDLARLKQITSPIESKMRDVGLSISYLFSDAQNATPKMRCDSDIFLYREAFNLKEPDRTFVLRMMLVEGL